MSPLILKVEDGRTDPEIDYVKLSVVILVLSLNIFTSWFLLNFISH